MCAATTILFLGGYLYLPSVSICSDLMLNIFFGTDNQYSLLYHILEGLIYGCNLAIKLIILMFTFI